SFFKNRCTPSIPLVSQGLLISTGPKNISYMRNVSAPYLATRSSGLTVLNLDLDIFSTSDPQIYFPSSRTNSASLYSPLRHCLNCSISSSKPFTKFTSTCILSSSLPSYSCSPVIKPCDTNLLVPLILYTKRLLPCIIPWLTSFLNGSSKPICPRSYKTFVHKRLYSKCPTACSVPPI